MRSASQTAHALFTALTTALATALVLAISQAYAQSPAAEQVRAQAEAQAQADARSQAQAAATAQSQALINSAQRPLVMARGINILGYDPLWNNPSEARFQKKHFKTIKDGGFDTVRFNLFAFRNMDANNRLKPEYLKTLDGLVQAAMKAGLNVILDEHDFDECAKDVPRCRPRLKAFWSQIADAYRSAPDQVMFEILNEPHGALDAQWNDVLLENLLVIRASNPVRNVIIGPTRWNSLDKLADLKLPANDKHIIVTFHYYTPMDFTHQGASWTPENKATGITWGTRADRDQLTLNFDKVQAWAKANDRPILLGEFGAYDKGPLPSRIAYTSAVARAAEARGWAWAYWQFDSDFVAYDVATQAWNEPIHGALIPEQAKAENAERKDDIAQYIINAPAVTNWSVYGAGQTNALRNDDTVQGKRALHIELKAAAANPWDVGAVAPIVGAIKKGDQLMLAFWARTDSKDPQQKATIPAMIQLGAAPYTRLIAGDAEVSSKWAVIKIKGTADADYASGQVNVGLHLGKLTVPVELGPVFVLDMGPAE